MSIKSFLPPLKHFSAFRTTDGVASIFHYNFFPTTLYRGAGIQTHVKSASSCTRLGPLKDALPNELQRRGYPLETWLRTLDLLVRKTMERSRTKNGQLPLEPRTQYIRSDNLGSLGITACIV